MNLHELHKKFGTSGLVLSVLVALLLMLFFGYQLAVYQKGENNSQYIARGETLSAIELENRTLRKALNERTAALEITKMDVEQSEKVLAELEEELAGLQDQLAFYERVMAPEMTQDGFFVDGVEINQTASEEHFRLRFVLLQQRDNKAVIKGDLIISVAGFLNGEPHTIKAGDMGFLPEGPVIYRFKFFQNVDIGFTLPENFRPESLNFATTVYQYTTRRGYYEKTLQWREVFNTVPSQSN